MTPSLSQELINKNYHPVILVGTRASGKTSLLTSLFRYVRTDSRSQAMCRLGEPIIPDDTDIGATMFNDAKRFFNHIVADFQDGKAAPRTSNSPYYIPIVFTPSNGQPETRFAILEIPGEFYQINRTTNDMYSETRWEVADVYKNYPGPISVVLVGPYVVGDAYQDDPQNADWYTQECKDSDLALYGALQSYEGLRGQKGNDHIAFLLTKWDAHTKGVGNPDFSSPPKGLIEHIINQRYPNSWSTFNVMAQAYPGKLIAMRYSSGLMSGDRCLPIPPQYIDSMNLYPRAVWSWLFSNANSDAPLYPQVTQKKTFLQWLKEIVL